MISVCRQCAASCVTDDVDVLLAWGRDHQAEHDEEGDES